MVKIAICDDETEFLDILSESLSSWCRAHQLTLQLYRFTNGDELISAHRAYGMDLILLDMIMPLLSGMDTARELRQADTAVRLVFLTSSPEFALESYEVRAFDYLLKPVTYERLAQLLDELSSMRPAATDELLTKCVSMRSLTAGTKSTRLPWLISRQEQIPATSRFIFRMSNIWKRRIRMC